MTNRPRSKITVSVFIALSFLSLNTVHGTLHGSITALEANGQMSGTVEHKIQNQTDAGDKQNIVRLLASLTQYRLEEAANILEITSKQDAVRMTPYFGNISQLHMGISENLDSEKRNVAKEILSHNKDFGSIYFTMPNGDVYIGEPFYDQKQLPRLNFADRDWYKGVTSTNATYTSSVFFSASIHAPATAIAVPVYSTTENSNIISNSSDNSNGNNNIDNKTGYLLTGYWVGIVDLQSVNETIKNLGLDKNNQITIVDHEGNEFINSNTSKNWKDSNVISNANDNSTLNPTDKEHLNQPQKINSLANLASVKKALSGNSGSGVEIVDGVRLSITYQPLQAGTHTWAVVSMSKT
ncbi:MAG: cache domain-containing protein [Nitrosopumilus sp.]|nr:cache domain-containing protein [Nitrosopumilus sp.]